MNRWALIAALGPFIGSCAVEDNYLDPEGPRFAGSFIESEPTQREIRRIVAYNIELGDRVEEAIVVLQTPPLADADVVLLQEMDAPGVERIAEALSMAWVYYPGSIKKGQDFGNAVLSRYRINGDHKVRLPNGDPFTGTRRIAVAALLDTQDALTVYSVHTATVAMGLGARLEQKEAMLRDAAGAPGPVVIGGDLNTADPDSGSQTRKLFADYDFELATPAVSSSADGYTGRILLDYIFSRGLEPLENGGVRDVVSDHDSHMDSARLTISSLIVASCLAGCASYSSRLGASVMRKKQSRHIVSLDGIVVEHGDATVVFPNPEYSYQRGVGGGWDLGLRANLSSSDFIARVQMLDSARFRIAGTLITGIGFQPVTNNGTDLLTGHLAAGLVLEGGPRQGTGVYLHVLPSIGVATGFPLFFGMTADTRFLFRPRMHLGMRTPLGKRALWVELGVQPTFAFEDGWEAPSLQGGIGLEL